MAKEIRYYGRASQTGDTLSVQLYDALGAVSGASFAMTEIGSTFVWWADMTGKAAGEYGVRILDGSTVVSQGSISWDGSFEVTNYHLGRILTNTRRTNDSNGREELMDEDGSTVLMYGTMWEDSAGTVAYDSASTGARRRNKLIP
jgi:hypothetical protein